MSPTAASSGNRQRRPRADGLQNRERLIAVAAAIFSRDGAQVSLKSIAHQAGVGIGTLYRHFPTREALVDAVYRAETDRLCAAAPQLLARMGPVDALREWGLQFLDYLNTKEGMAEVLHSILIDHEDLKLQTRARIAAATRQLLRAGQEAGELRADLDPADVSLALAGFALILERRSDARDKANRLLDLLLQGIGAP